MLADQVARIGAPRLVLPPRLVGHGLLQETEAVEVLDLHDGGDGHALGGGDAQVDVGVAAQAALGHLAVADAGLPHEQGHLLQVEPGLLAGGKLRLADDLQQGRAGAVEVDQGPAALMDELAGVLLQMGADQGDALAGPWQLQPASGGEGEVVLADLVVLGQVGIEVVLAVPLGERGDVAAQGQGGAQGQLEGPAVQHGQRAGQAQAHRAGRAVGRQAERGRAAAEELGPRQQLDVRLQADDGLVGGGHTASFFFSVQAIPRRRAIVRPRSRGGSGPRTIKTMPRASTASRLLPSASGSRLKGRSLVGSSQEGAHGDAVASVVRAFAGAVARRAFQHRAGGTGQRHPACRRLPRGPADERIAALQRPVEQPHRV